MKEYKKCEEIKESSQTDIPSERPTEGPDQQMYRYTSGYVVKGVGFLKQRYRNMKAWSSAALVKNWDN